jgi:hypothetical protein
MLAICKGGPYDGTRLDHNDIKLYCEFIPVGMRKFIILPAVEHWDAYRASAIEKREAFNETSPMYELIRYPDRIEAVFDQQGVAFGQAQRDEAEGHGPQPVEPPFTGAYYQCFRGDWVQGPGWSTVVDEKGRTWSCRQIGHDGWAPAQPEDTGKIWAMHREMNIEERLREVSLHCASVAELPSKLADQID